MAESIEIPIKLNGLAQIKAELRELKGQLANATDPEQMQQLAERAGQLSDQLKDANENVKNFATGSKFESIGNQFSSLKDSLFSLDFEEASDKAKVFSKSLTKLKPEDIGKQIKGLISTVASLGKAFITFGLQLLTNPIFLLVLAITAIVVAIGLFLNKMGLIKPIFDAIGKAIGFVIQKLKDFADWLGITNYAEEDKAKKSIQTNKKVADSYKDKGERIVKTYDRQIEIAKIEGKDTTQLEIAKQKAIIQTAQLRQKALQQQLKDNAVSNSLDKEQVKAIKDALTETKTLIDESTYNVKKIKTQSVADDKKANEETVKNNKEANDKKREQQKEYAKNRAETARQIEDTNILLMDEGITKELKTNEVKYKRLIEDNAKNSKLTASEKAIIDDQLKKQEFNEKKVINQKYVDLTIEENKISDAKKKESQDKLDADEKIRLEEVAKLKAETGKTAQELELQKIREDYAKKYEIAKGNKDLTIALEQEEKDKLAGINTKYAEQDIANQKKIVDFRIDTIKNSFNLVADLQEAFGSKSKEAQKKAFNLQKVANIASTLLDTYKSAQSAFSSQIIAGDPTSVVRGAVASGFAIAQGLIQVKKIASTQFEGGGTGGGGGGASAPSLPSMNPQTQMFSTGNDQANNLSSTNNGLDQPTIKAVVVESDITASQYKMNKIKESATL